MSCTTCGSSTQNIERPSQPTTSEKPNFSFAGGKKLGSLGKPKIKIR